MSARAWVAFAAVSTLWGMPYLFIKVAVDDGVPPAFLAWVRVVLGGAVLLGLAWRAGTLRSLRGRWRWVAVFAVVEICFPFPLIADTDEALCARFGVIKMKNMYGKQVRGIERSTFLIGPDGVLRREWRGVKVPGHAQEVLKAASQV